MSVTETGTRAREPDEQGFATTPDGLRLHWEVHGTNTPTIVLLPPCPISHSRIWKAQVHHLARHHRVVVYDGRGNGNSDAPDPAQMWLNRWWSDDCLTVKDASGAGAAVLVGICSDGVWPSLVIAAEHPERVLGIVAIAPGVPALAPQPPVKAAALAAWDRDVADPHGWEKMNAGYIREHQRDFLEFFFGEMFPEPHSEKHLEDAIAYGLDGSAAVLAMDEEDPPSPEEVERVCAQVRCPILIMQGDRDNCQPFERGARLAAMTGAEHVTLEGVGHIPNAREPVLVNRLIHDFARRFAPLSGQHRTWQRPSEQPRRALLLSSPIGLGHAWRDVAVARELRRLVPDLEIEWLAQPPLTTLLAECGERVHPASSELAPEAVHVDGGAGEHSLHAFQMLRRLDEIFCANFMVFHDVVEQERFDLWIADEAWEVDYFLHENPELKTAPYVWLTDFVGVVPMAEGGEREAFLAADHNAQMVEHVARFPHLRDRSIFVGDPEDLVPAGLGPGLPSIADWTREHFRFSGYINGFEPGEIADREALRAEFGFSPREKVCVVAAGGSGVGLDLMRRAVAAFPEAKERIPELRMIVVTGPRIDPQEIPPPDRPEAPGHVHPPYRQPPAGDPSPAPRRPRGPGPPPPASTGGSRRAPSASPPAGSRRRWSSPPRAGPSSSSRCAATSSRTTTSPTGSPATARGAG